MHYATQTPVYSLVESPAALPNTIQQLTRRGFIYYLSDPSSVQVIQVSRIVHSNYFLDHDNELSINPYW
jgi:hypothetical protein